ncbi:MAG: V-type proton ATPase subunit E [Firmicutes bacterium]|jgi:V/A-type H+-transporting ATPase subunit E|nr:V-type proton ATPase subunit E [Bacillota bacterium]
MGLDAIIGKIEADSAAEAARIEADAAEEAQAILRRAEERGRALAAEIVRRAQAAAEEQARRLITLAGLDARRRDLEIRQELVASAFERAAERLRDIQDGEYLPLIRKMLLQAAKTGDEEVILSPRDKARLTGSFIAAINEDLAASGRKGNLRISEETRPMLGGFILVEGKIESNNTFDVALRLRREDLEPEVAAVLFGE